MFKRWRALAAAAGAIFFPFALSHAATLHDDALHCTRYDFPNHRDNTRLDWQNSEQSGWLGGYFRNYFNDQTTDRRPGCFESSPIGIDSDDIVRGGNDDFSVTLGFEHATNDSANHSTDACEDPNCPSNSAGFRVDEAAAPGSEDTSVRISFEPLDESPPIRDDECPDEAFCPCYDAVILCLPEAIDDESGDRAATSFARPAHDSIRLFDVVEPFAFDEDTSEETIEPRQPSAVIQNAIEIEPPFSSNVELGAIEVLNDPAASTNLPRAKLTGTIEPLNDADADQTESCDPINEPTSGRTGPASSGPLTRFHMFYPGRDWSRYLPASDYDGDI